MSITDCKEVRSPILAQMWHHQVLVLVNFLWVLRAETSFRRKRKLSHTVVKLFLRCCNFSSYARISFYGLMVVRLMKLYLTLAYVHDF